MGQNRPVSAAMKLLLGLLFTLYPVRGVYISYEKERGYKEGERVPLKVNKLTSPETLESIDYPLLAVCWNQQNDRRLYPGSTWKRSMEALHADAFYTADSLPLYMKQDEYCRRRCSMNLDRLNDLQKQQMLEYRVHYWVDNMPTGMRTENDVVVNTNYWSGVPMARRGQRESSQDPYDYDSRFENSTESQVYVYNHINILVLYQKQRESSNPEESTYRIVRTLIQPFSVNQQKQEQLQINSNETVESDDEWALPSCKTGATDHSNFDMLYNITPQLAEGTVWFTYDVIWQEANSIDYKKRWDVFLTMDDAQPNAVRFLGVTVSVIICCILFGTLWTWVMRDLSYKPLMLIQDDEDLVSIDETNDTTVEEGTEAVLETAQEEELQMWPLSTRVFFPPDSTPLLFCAANGTGAHILATGFSFVVFFRAGIISQSLWANLLTPAIIIYSVCSLVGGYVTGRLACVLHRSRQNAFKAALITALAYPSMGVLVLYLVYDFFPSPETPVYNVVSNSLPLMLIWFFGVVPLTLLGSWWGHQGGSISYFPVSVGTSGYQDLDVHERGNVNEFYGESPSKNQCCCGKRLYILVTLLIGGLLPVLGVFVSYAYDVAGPVFVGYYVDPSSCLIASFGLFILSSSGVAMLLYYRQLRRQRYDWWWLSFTSGGSSGMYLFILTMTWLVFNISVGEVNGHVWALYTLWFAYTSFGAFLTTGFAGTSGCLWLTRMLYSFGQDNKNN